MIRISTFTILFISVLIISSSCVSSKLYQEGQAQIKTSQQERDELFEENEKLTVENTELKAKRKELENEMDRTIKSHEEEAEEMKRLKSEYNQINKRYDELNETHKALVSGSDAEARRLMKQLETTQNDLYTREDQLNLLSEKLNDERLELDRLTGELEARNKRLTELEAKLAEQDAAVDDLRKKVSTALMGFEGQGLSVTKKNGKVYVSLEEKLLFGSGSITVDQKGAAALKKLAGVLEQNKDINITIEGHTDDVPVVSGSQLVDNWDLSVRRATAIIRILLDNSSINPKRLTASGRGEYQPINPGKTAEARQKNRRTEIILTPNLDEIFEILEN
jgi:chemotaxis protein MotB